MQTLYIEQLENLKGKLDICAGFTPSCANYKVIRDELLNIIQSVPEPIACPAEHFCGETLMEIAKENLFLTKILNVKAVLSHPSSPETQHNKLKEYKKAMHAYAPYLPFCASAKYQWMVSQARAFEEKMPPLQPSRSWCDFFNMNSALPYADHHEKIPLLLDPDANATYEAFTI